MTTDDGCSALQFTWNAESQRYSDQQIAAGLEARGEPEPRPEPEPEPRPEPKPEPRPEPKPEPRPEPEPEPEPRPEPKPEPRPEPEPGTLVLERGEMVHAVNAREAGRRLGLSKRSVLCAAERGSLEGCLVKIERRAGSPGNPLRKMITVRSLEAYADARRRRAHYGFRYRAPEGEG